MGHNKELLGLFEFHLSFGHFEFVRRLGSSCVAIFHVVAFSLSSSYFFRPLVRFLSENYFRKPPVNVELLEFVIKRRSANHSWWPSSKAAPKSHPSLPLVVNQTNMRMLYNTEIPLGYSVQWRLYFQHKKYTPAKLFAEICKFKPDYFTFGVWGIPCWEGDRSDTVEHNLCTEKRNIHNFIGFFTSTCKPAFV